MHRFQGQKPKLTAAEINRWNRLANQQAIQGQQQYPTTERYDPTSNVVVVRNDSVSLLRERRVAHLDGLIWDLPLDGTADVAFKVKPPDVNADFQEPAILLQPLQPGETGFAVIAGLALAWVAGGPASLRYGEPDQGGTIVGVSNSDAPFRILAPPATNTQLRPVLIRYPVPDPGLQSNIFLAKTTSVITAISDSTSGGTLGSGTAKRVSLTSNTGDYVHVTSGGTIDLYSNLTYEVPTDTVVKYAYSNQAGNISVPLVFPDVASGPIEPPP